jgi:hypothetical protein
MPRTRNLLTSARLIGLAIALGFFPAHATAQSAPVVELSPTSLAFGSLLVGTVSVPQAITLTNIGDATLNITLINTSLRQTFHLFTDCGATVAPGASCTITINFLPQATGLSAATLSITDDAGGSPQTAGLSGTGIVAGAVVSPTNLNFGTYAVGSTSSPQSVTLTNQGTSTLNITGVTASSSDFAVTNGCSSTLQAGESCGVTMTFTPSAPGARVATLTFSDSDFSSPQLVQLNGAGTSGTAAVSPPCLLFGGQLVGTTSAAQTVTLTNSGTTDLAIISINASGDYAQTNTCGTSLSPGANCSLSITFTPSAAGTRPGFITLNDTDATNLQTVILSGTGNAPLSTLAVSPRTASVTFTQTQQFQAFLDSDPTRDVTWNVDGIVGGNSEAGTISTAGLYQPPATAGTHTIGAISTIDTSQKAHAPVVVTDMPGVFTQHNDNLRTGQNLQETVLTTGNVNVDQFGKLAAYTVDGVVRTQPLYLPNVNIPGQGIHNVIYVATEHDSMYAFDADGRSTTPLWQVSFIDPGAGITTVPQADVTLHCYDIGPEFGVSGTPVIDLANHRIFVLSRTKQVSGGVISYHQFLHALNISSGAEMAGSPVEIQASVAGTGEGSAGGVLAFDPLRENNRVGLLEANGVVYAAFSALCDVHPYHGWVIGYNTKSLQQTFVYNSSPNGQAAGVWNSGGGLAADDSGNVYLETSNGLNDISSGGSAYGESIVKLNPSAAVADYFTPFNATALTEADADLSSAGTLLLPDQPTSPTHLLLGGGKEGIMYLLDRDNMGKFRATDDSQILQSVSVPGGCGTEGSLWGLPAYYQSQVFEWPCGDVLHSFRLYQGLLSPAPVASSTVVLFYPPPTPSISANGDTNGIVWALDETPYSTKNPAVLHAYDAANVSRELWNSTQAGSRDQATTASKGPVPTIANGKVYVATAVGVVVYGLLP